MRRYFLQETKYGTPAVCLGAPAPESRNLEDSVTKVKQDNAGHMHTNTLTHTITHVLYARMRETLFVEDRRMREMIF